MSDIDDDVLMGELAEDFGVEEKPAGRSALEQRILAGFEEIKRFVETHGRVPQYGEGRDIFERLYAVRLDRLRRSPECRAVLKDVDARGLLGPAPDTAQADAGEPDDAELQAALGDLAAEDDVTRLVHVRSTEDRKAAEEVARRVPCGDFEKFRATFERVQAELDAKVRQTVPFEHEGGFKVGDLFILDGQKAYVAEVGELRMKEFGRQDTRLRVIFDNGTESNMLLRSLQRALYKVEHGRRILPPGGGDAGPLFAGLLAEDDAASGTIYVARSLSDHPFIKEHRELVHKIGVTGGDVGQRIAGAKKGSTYLLADVEIVATYKLANIDRKGLEALLHRFFGKARLDLVLKDRFGADVEPREWFLVPLAAIDEAIQKLKAGTIGGFRYDPETARIVSA